MAIPNSAVCARGKPVNPVNPVEKTLRLCATHMPVAFFVILRGVFVSARLGHGVARQGLGLARGLAHWRKGGACRTAAQPLPADAALVSQCGAPDLRGKSKIKLSQISWWKMGDKPGLEKLLTSLRGLVE